MSNLISLTMKRLVFFTFVSAMIILSSGCNRRVPGSGRVEMKNSIDSASYALGFREANHFKQQIAPLAFEGIDHKEMAKLFSDLAVKKAFSERLSSIFDGFNEEIFRTAFINELAYEFSYFDDITAEIYLQQLINKLNSDKENKSREMAKKGIYPDNESGKAFLEENAKRPEVSVTNSGLQFEIIRDGDGPIPQASDRIKCHYHGTLVNGKVFDSSVERGEPIVFGVRQVIAGWTEALQMMPVGSKWRLYVPSYLAYGENGAGDRIGPNETLIFEVELLEIVK
ncbi:FKBP-type peptidyl-prolyl cis-trans isomerase FklB [Natronoflexus pectinivorans]|uniref:Peptidyl-prolyl cis-trans isomerase n=2 Tax=Natronoflexus pectinivorans TaxID=682526 RepID=A0A4R2GIU1_9BACT|nr:FKBP-type peptidyl-prolyl cis-trans isomerase FklB [Natronoflexus pectinivorans]